MWNTKTVGEFFEKISGVRVLHESDEVLEYEPVECRGNFLCNVDPGIAAKSVVYISSMMNEPGIPEDAVLAKLVQEYIIVKESYVVTRLIAARNYTGMLEFVEKVSKLICEKLGIRYMTSHEIAELEQKAGREYLEGLIRESCIRVKMLRGKEEYLVEKDGNGGISLRPGAGGEALSLEEFWEQIGYQLVIAE